MAESTTLDTLAIWSYWILGLLIIGTMCYIMYTQFTKQVAAVLTFLISMLAMYYYYVKWFIIGDSNKESPTVCPDFMSVLKVYGDGSTNQFVCYDSGNVYKNRSAAFNSKQEAINEFGTESGPNDGKIDNGFVITPKLDGDKVSNFCSDLNNKGMSWISVCKSHVGI